MGSCDECNFWMQEAPEKNGENGTCQRYPPVIFGMQSCQPKTWKKTVCGEFVPRIEWRPTAGVPFFLKKITP